MYKSPGHYRGCSLRPTTALTIRPRGPVVVRTRRLGFLFGGWPASLIHDTRASHGIVPPLLSIRTSWSCWPTLVTVVLPTFQHLVLLRRGMHPLTRPPELNINHSNDRLSSSCCRFNRDLVSCWRNGSDIWGSGNYLVGVVVLSFLQLRWIRTVCIDIYSSFIR